MIKKNNLIQIIIFIVPFIYLFPLSLGVVAMGNDFDLIYYSYKKYFFEFLQEGIFPLWSPAETAGFSIIYNPFAQVFYIPGFLNYLILLLKGTFSLYDYLLFTILGISIFNIGLYHWLNFFIKDRSINFIVVIVTTSSLLITGLIKFPNAVHTFAWFPYVLLGINYSFYNNKKFKSFCLIFFPFIFLLTAGYPYFVVYFSFFLILYFIFIFIYQFYINNDLVLNNQSSLINFFIRNFLYFLTPLIFVLPWIIGVKSTLDLTNNRNIENIDLQFEYATEHTFNYIDIIGSWIFPIASSPEGRYNFGIFVSIIIIFFLISYLFSNFKTKKYNYLIISLLLFFIIITSLASGKDSYIFSFLWEKFDIIKNLRTWPRINILLVPVIALILGISLDYLTNYKSRSKFYIKTLNHKNLLIFIAFFILISQIFLFLNEIQSSYWDDWQKKRFDYASEILGQPFKFILGLYDGEIHIIFTFLIIIYILSFFNKDTFFIFNRNFFLISFVIITYSELFVISNLQWSLKEWKTTDTFIKLKIKNEFKNQLNDKREIKPIHGNNFFRDKKFQINNFMDWGYQSHVELVRKYYPLYPINSKPNEEISDLQLDNFKKFFGISGNTKIFISSRINHNNLESFFNDSDNFKSSNNFELNINWEEYYGNNLEINLITEQAGWLTFVDNWDPYWRAYINNKEVKIDKLFHSYKSVKFEKGSNTIQFVYQPFKFINLNK